MTSVFTPVVPGMRPLLPLKITTSVQEWCGHVFYQMNLEDDGYRFASRSGEVMITRAERSHILMLDYWNYHENRDRKLLPKLGLKAGG
ncbi:MAG: hypothetical protein JJV98_20695 [Desulfosarcina sp.]|nr:hypothetical protein [Desulfobacterales bacterium]